VLGLPIRGIPGTDIGQSSNSGECVSVVQLCVHFLIIRTTFFIRNVIKAGSEPTAPEDNAFADGRIHSGPIRTKMKLCRRTVVNPTTYSHTSHSENVIEIL
jgi:hypothetical protein